MTLALEPGGYRIFTTKKLLQPDIPVGNGQRRYVRDVLKVYPNPVKDLLFMEPSAEPVTLTVIDMEGRKIMETGFEEGEDRLDLSSLPAGLYVIRRSNISGPPLHVKIVKQ